MHGLCTEHRFDGTTCISEFEEKGRRTNEPHGRLTIDKQTDGLSIKGMRQIQELVASESKAVGVCMRV